MMQQMTSSKVGAGAASVGGLTALGHFLSVNEPVLASISHIAAIVVSVVTLFYFVRNRGH
jgi:hypothetical protein